MHTCASERRFGAAHRTSSHEQPDAASHPQVLAGGRAQGVGSQAATVGPGLGRSTGPSYGGGYGDDWLAELGVMASILRSRRVSIDAGLRAAAYLAAALAFGTAAISLFWTAGGSWLLDTVGGELEKLARGRSVGAMSLGGTAVVLELAAGLLALALVRPWGRQLSRRLLLGTNALASVILLVWGAANVCAGALVLGGVIAPADGLNERALRWHVFVWDPWFVVWGAALALAIQGHRRSDRDRRQPVGTGTADVQRRARSGHACPGGGQGAPR